MKLAVIIALLLLVHNASGQCVNQRARKHLQSARSYDSWGDARAEQEYRQATAMARGRCPDAWVGLSSYLAQRLQFAEAADAMRGYIKHQHRKAGSPFLADLRLLERAAELKSRATSMQSLSADEMVELVGLVDRFAREKKAAIPFAEDAVKLYPNSANALVALAKQIRSTQKERALELLNRAATLTDEAFVFNARGMYYFWNEHNPVKAESDFRRAIELSNGSSASAWHGLGDALAFQGRRKEAAEAYQKYLEVRPHDAHHHDELIKMAIEQLKSVP